MNRVLSKRFVRELREKLFRYIALGLLVAAGMTLVVSLAAAADTIIIGSNNKAEENKLEDGQFSVFVPFTEEQEKMLTDTGITLERMFSIDIKASDSSVLRVMKNRTGIDLIAVREGRTAEKSGEVLLEQRYCEENGINVGDTVEIGGIKLTVCGTGSVPDYDMMMYFSRKYLPIRWAKGTSFSRGLKSLTTVPVSLKRAFPSLRRITVM